MVSRKLTEGKQAAFNIPDPEKPEPDLLQFPSRTQIALLVETGGPENHYALLLEPGC